MRRDFSIRSLGRPAAAFALLGPLVAGLLAPLMLLLGGPLGLLLYPVYFVFWLPSFYVLLAPPLCLAGLLYGAAQVWLRPTLALALAAAVVGFGIVVGLRVAVTGSAAIPTPTHLDFGTDAASTAWSAVLAAVATAVVWWLGRHRDRVARLLRRPSWPRPLRAGLDLMTVAVTVAVVGGALALSRPPPPRTAWDDCFEADTWTAAIPACTLAIDAADETPERRLKALVRRMDGELQLAVVLSYPETMNHFTQGIADAERVQRQFGKDEHSALAYAHLHRGSAREQHGDLGPAIEDFDAVMALDPNGTLGQQAARGRDEVLALMKAAPAAPSKPAP